MDAAAPPATEKLCRGCDRTLPLDAFARNRSARDGRQSRCRECMAETKRAWYEANRERVAETNRAWYEANRERKAETSRAWYEANRERKAETVRAWREANRERRAEIDRAWREANRERVVEIGRAYRTKLRARTDAEVLADRMAARPDGLKECRECRSSLPFGDFYEKRSELDGLQPVCKRCRAARNASSLFGSRSLRRAVEELWADVDISAASCFYCDAVFSDAVPMHAEHMHPRRLGGEDVPWNLVPACAPCNLAKSATPLPEWLDSLGWPASLWEATGDAVWDAVQIPELNGA